MSNGPITKASPAASGGLQAAGVVLLAQAALRAFFLTSFLMTMARYPRLSQVVFGNLYPLAMSVVLPGVFLVGGVVAGLMLLARLRSAAAVAGIFCVLGLLVTAFGAFQVGYAYLYTPHHPPTQTYVLMATNAIIYLGALIAVARSA